MKSEKSVKSIINTYYVLSTIFAITYVALIALLYYFIDSLWLFFLLCVTLSFTYKILIKIIAYRTMGVVLIRDLDVQKLSEIISNKKTPNFWDRVSVAIYLGDYQTAINLLDDSLNKKKSINTKINCLSSLARIYFELRDFEKLKQIVWKYNQYKERYPQKIIFKQAYSRWRFYEYFLNGDYAACITISKERKQAQNTRKDDNLTGIVDGFFDAVVYYESGESEKAIHLFENILASAPKLHICNLANEYLQVIRQEKEFSEINLVPEKINDPIELKRKRKRLILNIFIALMVIVFLIFDLVLYKKPMSEYEIKLNAALEKIYDEYSIIENFDLEMSGAPIDNIIVVKDENQNYDILIVATADEGETFECLMHTDNINDKEFYCNESPTGEKHYIGIRLYLDENLIPEFNYKVVQIDYNGSKAWLCFEYIGNRLITG